MSTSTLGSVSARILHPTSFHPTLSLSLTPSLPSSLDASTCEAGVLVHLPSGMFYDPHLGKKGAVLTGNGDGRVELEGAVGWSSRASRSTDRQWWERDEPSQEQGGGGMGGLDMTDILNAALQRKVQEVKAAEPIKVSVDGDNRARVRSRTPPKEKKQDFRGERTTVVLPLDVDELLKGDGVRVNVPLGVRYHPPLEAKVGAELPAIGGPASALLEDITPHFARTLYAQARSTVGKILGSNSTTTSAGKKNDHLIITLPPPVIFLSCPGTPARVQFPPSHTHLQEQFTGNVVAQSKATGHLKVKVPVPRAVLLAPVQVGTLAFVVASAMLIVVHLLGNVIPALESVERLM
ncbi:hypothetical protein PSEUBRA_003834 [Kalmanozyma brasiliensis GHG001]|uniref:uncharacterized protein n=1 Tax=Kalmanozyma brasiliensis (strain GHG001) TaxID=1365824 RepID=UPI001CE9418A|nr:uncharacterized protein PSEUBRA_003834 [Kalmanozyma brasiliensis GHG001]KAF6767299.1 hypothetical protein PSEUBRA_003834 [Kalmanozyma brasiliensis GHG001]